jgi:hypothetical protein
LPEPHFTPIVDGTLTGAEDPVGITTKPDAEE